MAIVQGQHDHPGKTILIEHRRCKTDDAVEPFSLVKCRFVHVPAGDRRYIDFAPVQIFCFCKIIFVFVSGIGRFAYVNQFFRRRRLTAYDFNSFVAVFVNQGDFLVQRCQHLLNFAVFLDPERRFVFGNKLLVDCFCRGNNGCNLQIFLALHEEIGNLTCRVDGSCFNIFLRLDIKNVNGPFFYGNPQFKHAVSD